MKVLLGAKEEVTVRKLFATILFALATGFGAQLRIPLPLTPVPITLQTLFVLSSGVALGSFWGLASQFLYILLGIAGFPYFAGWNRGIGTLLGPTGGYLFGFLLASYISGIFSGIKELKRIYLGMALGNIVIYLFGSLWLSVVSSLPFQQALLKGVLPFIPGDTLKILAGGLFARRFYHWIKG